MARAEPWQIGIVVCALFAAACGGGATREPGVASDSNGDSDDSSYGDDSDSESESTESGATSSGEAAPRRAACSQGACSECGSGVCPPGMFCLTTSGGAGCSFLPQCGTNDRCSCLSSKLGSNCECEEQGGAARVSCH